MLTSPGSTLDTSRSNSAPPGAAAKAQASVQPRAQIMPMGWSYSFSAFGFCLFSFYHWPPERSAAGTDLVHHLCENSPMTRPPPYGAAALPTAMAVPPICLPSTPWKRSWIESMLEPQNMGNAQCRFVVIPGHETCGAANHDTSLSIMFPLFLPIPRFSRSRSKQASDHLTAIV